MNETFTVSERAFPKLTFNERSQEVLLEDTYVLLRKREGKFAFTLHGTAVLAPALVSLSYQPQNPKKWNHNLFVTENDLRDILALNYRILERLLKRHVTTFEGAEPATAADAMGTLALLITESIELSHKTGDSSNQLIYDYNLVLPHMTLGAVQDSTRRLEIIRKGYAMEEAIYIKDFPQEWFDEL